MDEHQRKSLALSKGRPNRLAKEVAGHECVDMELDELVPGLVVRSISPVGPSGLGVDAFFAQNAADAGLTYLASQLEQFTDDPQVAPTRILLSHPDDGLSNIFTYLPRAADTAWLDARFLLLDPALIGSELDNADYVFNLMLKLGTDGQEPGSFLGIEDRALAGDA